MKNDLRNVDEENLFSFQKWVNHLNEMFFRPNEPWRGVFRTNKYDVRNLISLFQEKFPWRNRSCWNESSIPKNVVSWTWESHVLILGCHKKSKMPKSGRAATWSRSIEGMEVFTWSIGSFLLITRTTQIFLQKNFQTQKTVFWKTVKENSNENLWKNDLWKVDVYVTSKSKIIFWNF